MAIPPSMVESGEARGKHGVRTGADSAVPKEAALKMLKAGNGFTFGSVCLPAQLVLRQTDGSFWYSLLRCSFGRTSRQATSVSPPARLPRRRPPAALAKAQGQLPSCSSSSSEVILVVHSLLIDTYVSSDSSINLAVLL